MSHARYDPVSLVAGLLFVVLGVVYLLDALDVWDPEAALVLPLLVIGLGLALLMGAIGRSSNGSE